VVLPKHDAPGGAVGAFRPRRSPNMYRACEIKAISLHRYVDELLSVSL